MKQDLVDLEIDIRKGLISKIKKIGREEKRQNEG